MLDELKNVIVLTYFVEVQPAHKAFTDDEFHHVRFRFSLFLSISLSVSTGMMLLKTVSEIHASAIE